MSQSHEPANIEGREKTMYALPNAQPTTHSDEVAVISEKWPTAEQAPDNE